MKQSPIPMKQSLKFFLIFIMAAIVIASIIVQNKKPNSNPVSFAQSKHKIEVLYLNFSWSDRTTHDKVARISGEVKNHSNKTVEVLVTVSARNSQNHIVDSKQTYAPLSGNVSPFGTAPFKTHFYNDGRDIQSFEASIGEVKVIR